MSAAGSRGAESPRLALGWAAAAPALTQSRGWHPRSRGIAPADRSRGIAPADPRKQNRPPRSEETFRLKSSGASTARRRRARGGDEAAPLALTAAGQSHPGDGALGSSWERLHGWQGHQAYRVWQVPLANE